MQNLKKIAVFMSFSLVAGSFFVGQISLAEEETNPAVATETATETTIIEVTGEQITPKIASEASEAAAVDQNVEAADLGVVEPTLLPDSPLYVFKDLWRGAKVMFTFNKIAKAEKRLKIASERLTEAKEMAEEKGGEAANNYLDKALEKYNKEMEKVDKAIEKVKEKAADNPAMEKFANNLVDSEIKKQKIFQIMEEKSPEEAKMKIMEAKEKSAQVFGKMLTDVVVQEKIADHINNVLENQIGSELKNFKNLEILKELEGKVPEEARDAIRQAEENTLARLGEAMNKMETGERAIKIKKYLGEIKGDPLRQLQILDDLKQKGDIPEDVLRNVETIKGQAVKKFEDNFRNIKREDIKNKFFEPFQGGEVEDMRVMNQLKDKIAPEFKEEMQKMHKASVTAFKEKFAGDVDASKRAEKFEELAKKMEENPDPTTFQMINDLESELPAEQKEFVKGFKERTAEKFVDNFQNMRGKFLEMVSTDDPEHIKIIAQMKDFIPLEAREGINKMMKQQIGNIEQKMRTFGDPEKMLEFRQGFETDEATKKEILKFKPDFIENTNAVQMEKIKEKLERFDDPEKMLKFREQFERKMEEAPGFMKYILKSQPDIFKQFDGAQLEVMKEKMSEIGDPEKVVEYRNKIKESFEKMDGIGGEILKNNPRFLDKIDRRQLDIIKEKIGGMGDTQKIEEMMEKLKQLNPLLGGSQNVSPLPIMTQRIPSPPPINLLPPASQTPPQFNPTPEQIQQQIPPQIMPSLEQIQPMEQPTFQQPIMPQIQQQPVMLAPLQSQPQSMAPPPQ